MTKTTYFHGHPGSIAELELAQISTSRISAPDHSTTQVVGFSLGAQAALTFAAHTPSVTQINLIAPAAPLSLGDFLPKMAGRLVFTAAKKGLLRPLTIAQQLFLRTAPNQFLLTLFKSSPLTDQHLLKDPRSKAIILKGIQSGLIENPSTYRSAVQDYVTDWQSILPRITAPVHIWQGDADTWVPPEMALALCDALPNADITILPEQGHFSTLRDSLPQAIGPAA